MNPRLLCLMLAVGLLAACSANKESGRDPRRPAQNPNHASMYYYVTGSLHFNDEAYGTAYSLFKRAANSDPGSYRIRRQMLLSAMYFYIQQRSDSLAVKKLVDNNREFISTDPELVDAAYNVYNSMSDVAGTRWAIDLMLTRYPTARAHVLNFIFSYHGSQQGDPNLLKPALELAKNDPQQLHALSQILDMVDPPSALDAAKRLYAIDPGSGSAMMVAIRLVGMNDPAAAKAYFDTLRYPQDTMLMYAILDEALQAGQLEFMNSVAAQVIATNDSELSYMIALAAMLSRNGGVMASVESSLADDEASQTEENYLTSLLIANSLLENDQRDLMPMLSRLAGSQDLENIVRFYILGMGTLLQDPDEAVPDSVYEDLSNRVASRLPDNVYSRFLISTALAIPEDDSLLALNYSNAKEDLILSYFQKGIYPREDINWLLSVYYQTGRLLERIPLLAKGISLYPDEHSWFNDLGYTLLTRGGDPEEAAELIFEALRMDPENPFYLDSIAWYYYLKGDYQQALESMSGVLDMPEMPSEIAYHIGLIYMRLNDFEAATRYMGYAAEGTDDPVHNQKAQRALMLWGVELPETR